MTHEGIVGITFLDDVPQPETKEAKPPEVNLDIKLKFAKSTASFDFNQHGYWGTKKAYSVKGWIVYSVIADGVPVEGVVVGRMPGVRWYTPKLYPSTKWMVATADMRIIRSGFRTRGGAGRFVAAMGKAFPIKLTPTEWENEYGVDAAIVINATEDI